MNQPKRILIVDDEAPNRDVLAAMVASLGHEPEVAQDGVEALAKVRLGVDLVLLDVRMPGMDGFEVARRIRKDVEAHDVPIIMVTGLSSQADRLRAVEAGANDFIAKPIDLTELGVRTTSLLRMKEAQDTLKRNQILLEDTVQKRTAALRQALEDMVEAQRRTQEAYLDTIHRLALAAEYRDEQTAVHIHRVSHYCAMLARELHLTPGEVETLLHASPMHDVGKIGIADSILLKPGKLTEDEKEAMKQHTLIGGRILTASPSELLRAGEVIALSHHERWDGSGYPQNLAGEAIPLYGRICAVVDVFDALTTRRFYKEALSNDQAITIMTEGRGTHFDPALLDLFTERFDEVAVIQEQARGNGHGQ